VELPSLEYELAYSRQVGAAKDVKSRIEVVGEEIIVQKTNYSTKDKAMANSNALKKMEHPRRARQTICYATFDMVELWCATQSAAAVHDAIMAIP
jgi:hypothetical protein